ncbi:serine/threonine-protein kinase PRP4 [Fistulifera solaris]|uniref:Serine/threonine-protein kinase PRP4 n=1 Tax=Fistulifera solaris TaxID=1519565 RepID=A0A1Z5KNK1_FISSO|nr:serine/threonine-protein kinase PRP4 [Fistulifera solaris]|eukprot:GAX27903.1 serine/threonine-protein kinase PRP4 [Fistulifera solaris]
MDVDESLDEAILLGLQDDTFVTEEQRQEAEAERRRKQRQQRLLQLQAAEEASSPPNKEEPSNHGSIPVREPLNHFAEKEDDMKQNGEDEDDEFDMFSSSVSPVGHSDKSGDKNSSNTHSRGDHNHQEDWDDAEGYYKAVIGETISVLDDSIRLRVAGVVGKGVFSTVIQCSTISNTSSTSLPPIVALKCIRHNETMAKAAMNELQTLQKLKGSPGIVPLLLPTTLTPLEHRGHVLLIFTYMEYNLRDVLQKFGKGVGLSLPAVRSYFGQLLAAATHLQKHGIIHADIKPDNILVSSDFSVVQLADFGSAIHVNSPEQSQVTPYLVSRFYRAPEIVLGLTPTFAIDLWSIAVSVAELFLGDVVFRGRSNNEMLYEFMQHLGPFSNRVIRQHLVQCQKFPDVVQQFQASEGAYYVFLQQTVDAVSGNAVHKRLSLQPTTEEQKFPLATPLKQRLLKAKSANDSKKIVFQFADLLQKCLALDSSKRIPLKEALRHEFFQK